MADSVLPQLELSLAIKRVKKDFRDEWFADPLNYDDVLKTSHVREYFANTPAAINGEEAEQFNLPKHGFTLRYSLETSIYDKVLYQALIDKLIVEYDALLSPRVLSHRLSSSPKSVYIFKHGIEAWKRHLTAVKAELTGTRKVLLVTDIQNYYA